MGMIMIKTKRLYLVAAALLIFSVFVSCQSGGAGDKIEATDLTKETPDEREDEFEMAGQIWMSSFTPWALDALDAWTQTRDGLDVLCVFIDAVVNASDDEFERFCALLKRTGLKLSVECAGICDWYANLYAAGGDEFAYNSVYGDGGEFKRLGKKLKDNGVAIDYLNIDHGILRGTNPADTPKAQMSTKEAAEQLYLAMKHWRNEFPDIKFNYIVNFPNHGWKGGFAYNHQWNSDFFCGDFYEDFLEICRLNEETDIKMNAVIVDFPYNYAVGRMPTTFSRSKFDVRKYDWIERILDLEAETKAAGMKFGLIFNSDIAEYGRRFTPEKYYADTVEYLNLYISRGGRPHYYINESWYFFEGAHVPELLPETERYTMTNLTLEFIKIVGRS